jgi:cytochrome c oxidase subunit II
MSSADVTHSFWVPRLAGKMDLIPNRLNTMWIDPPQPGLYLGQCAQYCGAQHAKMLLRVYADTPEQFAAWAAQQTQPAQQNLTNPVVAEGREVFLHNACINYHTVAGTIANGRFGPALLQRERMFGFDSTEAANREPAPGVSLEVFDVGSGSIA